MPNWCDNTVEIYHKDPAMIERVRKGFNEGGLLNEFFPCPAELHEHTAPEQDEARAKRFVEQYGASDWYNWQVQNWGTKWDVGGDGYEAQDIPNGLLLTFESAWSPPTGAYEKLVEQGFEIRAMYYEPGMAFAGIWDNGNDDYYEYGGMNSTQIAEELPEVLDEAFGISESVAEWKAENEEDENEEE